MQVAMVSMPFFKCMITMRVLLAAVPGAGALTPQTGVHKLCHHFLNYLQLGLANLRTAEVSLHVFASIHAGALTPQTGSGKPSLCLSQNSSQPSELKPSETAQD